MSTALNSGVSFGGIFGSYTPTWTATSVNPSIGDGTLAGSYTMVGKMVIMQIKLTWGTTTSAGTGEWIFSLPITASSKQFVGGVYIFDNGVGYREGCCTNVTTTTLKMQHGSNGAHIGSAYPAGVFNASGDYLVLTLMYEAA